MLTVVRLSNWNNEDSIISYKHTENIVFIIKTNYHYDNYLHVNQYSMTRNLHLATIFTCCSVFFCFSSYFSLIYIGMC